MGDSFLPFDFYQLEETGCVVVVQLSGMSAVDGPRFTGVKECSDNYGLVDLKLGARTGAPILPDVGLKSPKGAAGLGDSALDTGQGAS